MTFALQYANIITKKVSNLYFSVAKRSNSMNTIKRDLYLKQLIDRKDNGLVKVITGIRRSGKSYLLFHLYRDYLLSVGIDDSHIIQLALDEDRHRKYRKPDNLVKFLNASIKNDSESFYIFLDEVQFAISKKELKSKEPIRLYGILNELIHRGNVDVYVTGSNSKFLSSDVMTEFHGRGDEVRVYPLSFAEFMSAYQGNKYDGFYEYSTYGGLPLILDRKTETAKIKYLSDLFNTVYVKDISERHHLRTPMLMDNLLNIVSSSVGSLTNPLKLANSFSSNGMKVSEKTVSSYIDHLMDAFVLAKAERYDIKGKRHINSPYKYYFTDIGLRNARLNFRQQEQPHILENIIYNELIVRGYNVDVGIVEKNIRDENGKQQNIQYEVDFVCNLGSKRYYIQSAFSIPDSQKMEQERTPLLRINDSFKKFIIVQDHIKTWQDDNGFIIMNVLDFLLNPDSLNY